VNCWDKIKELPSGVLLLVGKNFSTEHPGFYFLTDGRCAVSPSASLTSVSLFTKAYDLQWFGTRMAGTPLNNHYGIETNATVPEMMPPYGPLLFNPITR
jgi:hypothetical protein